MATYLSDQKKQKIYDKCCEIPTKTKFILRKIASFIVTLISILPEKFFGPIYYRAKLKFNVKSLENNECNFNAIKFSEDNLHEILWWRKNICKGFKPIKCPKIIISIYSIEPWIPEKKLMQFNILGLMAI